MKTPVGVEAAAGETPSLTREVLGETRGLERAQAHPLRNQHQKGPICLWVAGEVTENWQRAEQEPLFPLRQLPHIQHHSAVMWVALPWGTPKAPPLYLTETLIQKKLAQVKEQIKAPEKIQLSNEKIANLSDTQFKTLVIRMLTELLEFGHKLDEK